MSQQIRSVPKPKKSVALSGAVAGNTAICSLGRNGNDLRYRGYDIHELAKQAEFEEVAFLLLHGRLPTQEELAIYQTSLLLMREFPSCVKKILEQIPATTHPMDVMRTACSALGACQVDQDLHSANHARAVIDQLIASLGSMLLYWYHFSQTGQRIDLETEENSIGAHFLDLLHGKPP